MPDDKVREPGDQGKAESAEAKTLKSSDAQDLRNAGSAELATVAQTRTNASDGSLRRFSGIDLDAQSESIEIDFGDRVVSRKSPGSEQAKPAFEVQPVLKPQVEEELTAVALSLDATAPSEELKAVALSLDDARSSSGMKPIELQAVAYSLNEPLQGATNVDVHPRGAKPPHTAQGASHSAAHSTDQPAVHTLEVQARIISPQDSSMQEAAAPEKQTLVLRGSVEENVERPAIASGPENNIEGWMKAADQLAKLPLDQQLQLLSYVSTAAGDTARRVVIEGTIGAIVGPTEAVGHFLENLAHTTDFVGAILKNDKAAAAEYGDKFGSSLAKAVVNGRDFIFGTGNYLGSLGEASSFGDNTKILRDADNLMRQLDREWAQLPVKEQTRILTALGTEFYLEKLTPSTGHDGLEKLFSAEKIEKFEAGERVTGVLKLLGTGVKESHERAAHEKLDLKNEELTSVRSEYAVRGLLAPLIRQVNSLG